jgi:guanylate kinase
MKKGLLIILSGPSGVGKGTIRRALMEKYTDLNLVYSISMTTRLPRQFEKEGEDYFFVDEKTFDENIAKGNFLEHTRFVEHQYGTPRDYVERLRNEGKNVLLEIDIRGAKQVMKILFGDTILSIFVTAPSIDAIEARIRKRHTESEEQINERLEKARNEMHLSYLYDYVVVNDEVDKAVDQIASILKQKIAENENK